MVIVKLNGGLGNQMFQYAAARRIAYLNAAELKFDLSWFEENGNWTPRKFELGVFTFPTQAASPDEIKRLKTSRQNPLFRRLPTFLKSIVFNTRQSHIIEKHFAFDPEILSVTGNVYLDGYWQSSKYFEDIEGVIRSDFTFVEEMDDFNASMAQSIQSFESVALHIRRGDYVTLPAASSYHGLCSMQYYESAIEFIKQKVTKPVFFVFSDDIEWAKNNLCIGTAVHYVDKSLSAHCDMRLMSLCHHHIIANSSFSWWGAWLAEKHDKIVIAPRQWFKHSHNDTKDLIPESWKLL